jgi:hypothetical protein
MQKSIFPQKIQKSLCITTKSLYQNFKRNYLENYNDSEHVVKTKNAPCFMNFPNINKNGQLFPHWTGPLSFAIYGEIHKGDQGDCVKIV